MPIIKFFVVLLVFSMLSSMSRAGNDVEALIILVILVAFWKIRPITEWLQDRRWRDNWRTW